VSIRAGSVTVVTITRGRPALLQRCVGSVRKQDLVPRAFHFIVADDCRAAHRAMVPDSHTRMIVVPRTAGEVSGPSRLARLRNLAARLVTTEWIAFLDDDCEYERDHLSSLVRCATEAPVDAVYSYRQLLRADGDPFLERRWPWCRDPQQAMAKYEELEGLGVVQSGSHVIRDGIDRAKNLWTVDTNEWLISTRWLVAHPIAQTYGEAEWAAVVTEDEKLLYTMHSAGARIASTRRPTVRYYLGGYSNDFEARTSGTERWVRPAGGST
jgi:glycosyltransferase involved in cell wall biosynthesis